ncbi:FG-GAP and VCBS repeat-containing protein [Streptomyces katsurahamanus]|uniref:Integrin-like protein n=1 Tax=Streptomyces katsurahamanus TaxID=2577098 RepID=A0ABW9NQ08_9ACTN|nr:FG-GAP and VCBS repeat-containing protein [Streptomyces katsurahamanus]MQS35293.1 integrin-like protein [Streptomyces katsurahamanus]
MRTTLRTALATAVTVSLTGGLLGLTTGSATAAVPAKAAKTVQPYDFNGDGNRDYAIWDAPRKVAITYGTKSGPGTKTFTFNQDSPGIPGENLKDDGAFGEAMTSADFNGDGYADLVVSDENEKLKGQTYRGIVVIVWGSKSGLGSQASALPVDPHPRMRSFGLELAAGDFSGDGKPDIAVADDRAVNIYRGGFTPSGTTGEVSSFVAKTMSQFYKLAPGKVTEDGATDLYVTGEGRVDGRRMSSTWFLKGGSTIESTEPVVYRSAANQGRSPYAVVADFDKDGYGDLAFNDIAHKDGAGAVFVLSGGANGPTTLRRITQDTPGIATSAGPGEHFGSTLSAGDTNRDGYADLAVGTTEEVGPLDGAGGAHVLHGGKKGLTGTGSKWFTRDTKGIPGKAEEGGGFGVEVRMHDFDRDRDADLLLSDYSKRDEYDGTVLGGGRDGITTKHVRKVSIPPTFAQ